jgi:hypothetical protein
MFEKILLGKNETKTNVFLFVVEKGKKLRWLRWFGGKNLV